MKRRTRRPLLQAEIELAIKNSKSAKGAARFLGVSYNTFKKYAQMYTDENGNAKIWFGVWPEFINETITIYGRFGKKMYESVGYKIPWDGTNQKGKSVPDGSYFYVITLKGSIEPIRGMVTIIR